MVRLSQCMIVKNEERNIEKALSWAKRIAFEQIVVDTGSTDRTVEIAEQMGAKVYHFKWIDDFAAAKNFAIEQAIGNWIAFLDADEYFSPVDAKKVMVYLKNIMSDPEMQKNYLAINCKWSQVDDAGKPFSVNTQERIFRNLPNVRYIGRIHEKLNLISANIANAREITIIHTGYSATAYEGGVKAERNIELIERELDENPDDPNMKIYLADSLLIRGDTDSDAKALALYREAIDSGRSIHEMLRKSAFFRLIEKGINSGENPSDTEELCRRALEGSPGDMDFEYYLAIFLYNRGEHREAWDMLKGVEEKLINAESLDEARLVTAKPEDLFSRMVLVAQSLRDVEGVIRYATMVLTADKTNQEVLGPYIATMLGNKVTEDELIELLAKLYDMKDAHDLLLIARAAKNRGALDFARRVVAMIKT